MAGNKPTNQTDTKQRYGKYQSYSQNFLNEASQKQIKLVLKFAKAAPYLLKIRFSKVVIEVFNMN